jgi:rfaE bifunctional protein nucleotidyltransferase chain/domain
MDSIPKDEKDTSGPIARDHIKSVAELAEISRSARAEGKKVVLAHGVFDLMHLGHVRHLEAARRLGDILIVTVTGDKYVDKGPGRPVFAQTMRAEMLAAVNYVDWTGVNEAKTAEKLIEAIQPNVYVKGGDYANTADDVTGKIEDERALVEKHGGRVVFTDEVTFSSSALINEHFNVLDPRAQTFLDELRRDGGAERALELIDRISNLKVLFIGETIIDQYDYVEALGKAGKENIIATLYKNKERFAGGVVAAANHLAEFCKEVEIVTCLGGLDDYDEFVRELLPQNVRLKSFHQRRRPTLRKRRFVEQGHLNKLFEVYYMQDSPLEEELVVEIDAYLQKKLSDFDLVVVCDFGHGMMVDPLISRVHSDSKFLAANAQANAGNMGYNLVTKYAQADYVCIDDKEARLASREKRADLEFIISERLQPVLKCDHLAVTQGTHGCLMWGKETQFVQVPAFAHTPVDTIGAGDAFLAVTSALCAVGGNARDVGFIGNIVGGLKIGVVGHRSSVEKNAVKKTIVSLLK